MTIWRIKTRLRITTSVYTTPSLISRPKKVFGRFFIALGIEFVAVFDVVVVVFVKTHKSMPSSAGMTARKATLQLLLWGIGTYA
jgi:hypothetical protein